MRRSFPGRTVKLRHIKQSGWWPSGNPRLYLRVPGQSKNPALPDLPPDDPRFLAVYADLLKTKTPDPVRTGTIAAAVIAFQASDKYLGVSENTRRVWRRGLDDIRTRYGRGVLSDLRTDHIRLDLDRLKPNPANQRLKIWRAACGWWHERRWTEADLTHGIKRPKVPKSDGHQTWTEADVDAFRAHWPIHSAERLAFELIHWTGARISDAVLMTEAKIGRDGWMTYVQVKTGGQVAVPISAPAPGFSDPSGQAHLLAAIAARPVRHVSLMVTAYGSPRSVKAASAWFSAAARAAGIDGKAAHGLRKRRAVLMAERGATTHQSAAWMGHETLTEVDRYSKAASRRRIISGTEVDNSPGEVVNFGGNTNEINGR